MAEGEKLLCTKKERITPSCLNKTTREKERKRKCVYKWNIQRRDEKLFSLFFAADKKLCSKYELFASDKSL